MIDWLILNIDIILLILTPPVTWFFTKRHFQKLEVKEKTNDVDSSTSDIVSKNLELYQKMLDDIEARYEEKLEKRDLEIKLLEKKCDNFRKRIDALEKEING